MNLLRNALKNQLKRELQKQAVAGAGYYYEFTSGDVRLDAELNLESVLDSLFKVLIDEIGDGKEFKRCMIETAYNKPFRDIVIDLAKEDMSMYKAAVTLGYSPRAFNELLDRENLRQYFRVRPIGHGGRKDDR